MTTAAVQQIKLEDPYQWVGHPDSWYGLYSGGKASKDPELYTPEATRHPAKMSLLLLRRIIREMLDREWLAPGQCLIDPFGGRAATGLEWCKLHPSNLAFCMDVEEPFVQMGEACRALAAETYPWIRSNLEVRCGDSRQIHAHLTGGNAAVSSPPYGKGVIGSCTPAQVERLKRLTQDPTSSLYGRDPNGEWFKAMEQGYINSPGNIDLLESDGDYADLDIVRAHELGLTGPLPAHLCSLSSPPYESSLSGDDPEKRGGLFRDPKRANDRTLTANYLASVSSPPFEAQSGGNPEIQEGPLADPRLHERHAASRVGKNAGYGENHEAQIGTKRGETYASACGQVYRSLALANCRYVALVTKNPVSKGMLKPLDALTIRLMEEVGYRLAFRKRAWLWETRSQLAHRGAPMPPLEKVAEKTRANYAGREDQIPHGRLTFFHMIHMAKGRRAPAQWEDVLFFELGG